MIWLWGWARPDTNKNEVYTSRKILNYALNLPVSTDKFNFLKDELLTSNFLINDMIQIDMHILLYCIF